LLDVRELDVALDGRGITQRESPRSQQQLLKIDEDSEAVWRELVTNPLSVRLCCPMAGYEEPIYFGSERSGEVWQ
jgi:hypothetical protein